MKNQITIVMKLDSQFQVKYCLDNGNRVGAKLFSKDVQLVDIMRYVRNLISPWEVDISVLFEVTQIPA